MQTHGIEIWVGLHQKLGISQYFCICCGLTQLVAGNGPERFVPFPVNRHRIIPGGFRVSRSFRIIRSGRITHRHIAFILLRIAVSSGGCGQRCDAVQVICPISEQLHHAFCRIGIGPGIGTGPGVRFSAQGIPYQGADFVADTLVEPFSGPVRTGGLLDGAGQQQVDSHVLDGLANVAIAQLIRQDLIQGGADGAGPVFRLEFAVVTYVGLGQLHPGRGITYNALDIAETVVFPDKAVIEGACRQCGGVHPGIHRQAGIDVLGGLDVLADAGTDHAGPAGDLAVGQQLFGRHGGDLEGGGGDLGVFQGFAGGFGGFECGGINTGGTTGKEPGRGRGAHLPPVELGLHTDGHQQALLDDVGRGIDHGSCYHGAQQANPRTKHRFGNRTDELRCKDGNRHHNDDGQQLQTTATAAFGLQVGQGRADDVGFVVEGMGLTGEPAAGDAVGHFQLTPGFELFGAAQAVGLGNHEPQAGLAVHGRRDALQGVAAVDLV